jgi:AcrR family transcriptional regulator
MATIGRPRAFDREMALRAAMLVFWRNGFVATSMNDLCDAMGIRSPSLYATFGSKENLYLEAVDYYTKTVGPLVWEPLLNGPSARAGVENLLFAAARAVARDLPGLEEAPGGCMVTLAVVGEACPGSISDTMRRVRQEWLGMLRARLTAAVAEGELPSSTHVENLSRFYLGVFQGIALQGRDGATRLELEAVAETAMSVWPC